MDRNKIRIYLTRYSIVKLGRASHHSHGSIKSEAASVAIAVIEKAELLRIRRLSSLEFESAFKHQLKGNDA